jgi:hypothetical protein
VIYRDPTEVYLAAQANSPSTADAIGVVQSATGTQFTVIYCGQITIPGAGWTDGNAYYLSDTTAGLLTLTAPSTAGEVSKPLMIATGSTTGLVFNWRGEVIEAAPSGISGASGYSGFAVGNFKNILDNGNFQVQQRGTAFSGTTTVAYSAAQYYVAGRWFVRSTNVSVATDNIVAVSGYSGTGYPIGPPGAWWGQSVVGVTGCSGVLLGQRIEAATMQQQYQNGLYLSWWQYNKTASRITPSVTVMTPATADGWTATAGSSSALGSAQLLAGSGTSGTWGQWGIAIPTSDMTQLGLEVDILEGNILGPGTVVVAHAQLEQGSGATTFEVLPPAVELAMCQRRYWTSLGNVGFPLCIGYNLTGDYIGVNISFPVTMAAQPTITIVNGTTVADWNMVNCTSILYMVNTAAGVFLYAAVTSTGNASFYPLGTTSGYVYASCDL